MGSAIRLVVAFKIFIGIPSTTQLVFDSNVVTMSTISKGVIGKKNMEFLLEYLER